jgi:hypothetical protein
MCRDMSRFIAVILFITVSNSVFSHPGIGIVMDKKQNVFYTDLKQVWKIDKTGKRSIAVKDVHTHELYLDKNDNLFGEHLWYEGEASDKWGFFLWKLSSDGELEKVVPNTEGFPDEYSFIRDEHHMFIANRKDKCQQVVKKTEIAKKVHSKECFENIRWMTRSERGNIYLIDGPDLKKIDINGNVELMAESIAEKKASQTTVSDQHAAMGLWTDKQENVYVAIYGARIVKKVTPDKKVSEVIETSLRWSPTGGFLDPNGDLWLLECSPINEVRVERITKDGQRIIYE